MNPERVADAGTAVAWSLWGISSMAQIEGVLRLVVLILTGIATAITIYVHVRNKFWIKK